MCPAHDFPYYFLASYRKYFLEFSAFCVILRKNVKNAFCAPCNSAGKKQKSTLEWVYWPLASFYAKMTQNINESPCKGLQLVWIVFLLYEPHTKYGQISKIDQEAGADPTGSIEPQINLDLHFSKAHFPPECMLALLTMQCCSLHELSSSYDLRMRRSHFASWCINVCCACSSREWSSGWAVRAACELSTTVNSPQNRLISINWILKSVTLEKQIFKE